MVEIKVSDRILIQAESLYKIDLAADHETLLFLTKKAAVESGDIWAQYPNGKRGTNPMFPCIRFSSVISQIPTKLPQDTEMGRMIVHYSRDVMEQLKNILFLDPEPPVMRGYSRINDVDLKVNASNLSAVLNKICKDKSEKSLLLEIMRKLPENEITDITFLEGSLNDVTHFEQLKK